MAYLKKIINNQCYQKRYFQNLNNQVILKFQYFDLNINDQINFYHFNFLNKLINSILNQLNFNNKLIMFKFNHKKDKN